MKILIFGGFLGSGKTTVIKQVVRSIASSGQSVAVIENEIGDVGIDQDIISETGVTVTPIFGGCVCCELTGNLFAGIKKIKADIFPDWLVIECTGFAMMTEIIAAFHKYSDPDVPAITVSIVDNSRFDVLMKAMRSVIEAQLDGVDAVIVNKTDITPLSSQREALLSELSGQADILPIAASQTAPDELWSLLSGLINRILMEE